MTKTIHAIAFFPLSTENGSVGGSNWFTDSDKAREAFKLHEAVHTDDFLFSFRVEVPADATHEEITNTVDDTARDHESRLDRYQHVTA